MKETQFKRFIDPNLQSDRVSILPFNPSADSFIDARYALYRKYQNEDPFHWGASATPTSPGSWYIFGYDDIVAILRDSRFGKKTPNTDASEKKSTIPTEQSALWELTTQWMVLSDPPKHSQYRSIFKKVFGACFNPAFSSCIPEIAETLASKLPDYGTFDLIAEFVVPLPICVISELMGVPLEYQNDVRRWSQEVFLAIDLKNDKAKYEDGAIAAQEVSVFLRDLISHKRRFPKDDFISKIVHSEEGRKLNDDELVSNLSLFLFAGSETTVGLIGNGVFTLLQNPDKWHHLSKNNRLIPSAIDEILRFESPVQATTRFALTDVTFAGNKIHKGDLLCLMFGAGNRDPRKFVDPDQFDITRAPNRHLGFGYGPHFCIGSALGTLEGQIAFQALLHEIPSLQLQMDTPKWHNSVSIRSLQHLHVSRG